MVAHDFFFDLLDIDGQGNLALVWILREGDVSSLRDENIPGLQEILSLKLLEFEENLILLLSEASHFESLGHRR